MKPLLFFGIALGTLYTSLRSETVFWLVIFLFLLGCAFVVFASLYHYLGRRGHF